MGIRTRRRKSPQSRFVGVMFYDAEGGPPERDTSGRGFLTGLSEAAALHDTSLIVHRFGPDSMQILDSARQPTALRDGLLEGLILVHRIDPQAVRELASRLPTVLLTHAVSNVRADLVDSDHAGAMGKLMDHLHKLGHRRIGFVGRFQSMPYSQARFGSFCQSLSRLNLELRPDWLLNVFSDYDFDRQAELAAEAVKAGVTAFMCANDHVGYEITRRLIDLGLRVPEDVSLTGFDAMEPILNCPPLTTVRVPFEEMGAAALMRLLARIQRPSLPALQNLFDCQLVVGQTTAAAR